MKIKPSKFRINTLTRAGVIEVEATGPDKAKKKMQAVLKLLKEKVPTDSFAHTQPRYRGISYVNNSKGMDLVEVQLDIRYGAQAIYDALRSM